MELKELMKQAELIPTRDFKRSWTAITKAVKKNEQAIITGDSGSGKSVVLDFFMNNYDGEKGIIFVEGNTNMTVKDFLLEIIKGAGQQAPNARIYTIQEVAKDILKDKILIIDELNMLSVKHFHTIRQLWGKRNFPLILAGIPSVLHTIKRSSGNNDLSQFINRFIYNYSFKKLTEGELKNYLQLRKFHIDSLSFKGLKKLYNLNSFRWLYYLCDALDDLRNEKNSDKTLTITSKNIDEVTEILFTNRQKRR